MPENENLSQGATGEGDKIGFSITSGAYFVETNGGGKYGTGMPGSGMDATIGAYRANAACAQFSRIVAAQIYGTQKHIYGYAFGGSGGAYRTIGGLEKYRLCMGWCSALCTRLTNGYSKCVYGAHTCHAYTA